MTIHLDFAPGTTDDCKRLVQQHLTPNDLFDAYRLARHTYSSGDIVLVIAAHDPEIINGFPRSEYIKSALGRNTRAQLAVLGIANRSAHQVMMLPADSDAFWLVIEKRGQLPIMVVLHATRHEKVEGSILVTH